MGDSMKLFLIIAIPFLCIAVVAFCAMILEHYFDRDDDYKSKIYK
jgi:hypothetical protein